MSGSCALQVIADACAKMGETHKEQLSYANCYTWRDNVKKSGLPALNGQIIRLDCRDSGKFEAFNHDIRCQDGQVRWDVNVQCRRKACVKPTLADQVEFVEFQERNLHTRIDLDVVTEGVLLVRSTAPFNRPKPDGEYDKAKDAWKYVCQSDKTWQPSLGDPPHLEKERPRCKQLQRPPKEDPSFQTVRSL